MDSTLLEEPPPKPKKQPQKNIQNKLFLVSKRKPCISTFETREEQTTKKTEVHYQTGKKILAKG